ncbi:MAG: hypothetical protein EOP52_14090 [Sphingobacteriales bacterium]|nr:MAG: hypothetical protein EOP52_14090 [Sphingobacteriales bacterium]
MPFEADDGNTDDISPCFLMSRLHTKVKTAWEFVKNPENYARVAMLLKVCKVTDRVTLEVSKDFPSETLLDYLTNFHNVLESVSTKGLSAIDTATADAGIAKLRDMLETSEEAAQFADCPTTNRPDATLPAASLHTSSSASQSAVAGAAPPATLGNVSGGCAPMEDVRPAPATAPKRRCSSRTPAPRTEHTNGEFAYGAQLAAMTAAKVEDGVHAHPASDKPVHDAMLESSVMAAAAEALAKYKKHISVVLRIVRGRNAFLPWVRPTADSLNDACIFTTAEELGLFKFSWGKYVSRWEPWPSHTPKTHEETIKYWDTIDLCHSCVRSVALRALSVSLSSVSVERAFSIQNHMASNPRRSTMTEQHVIEQLKIRCNGKDFILRRLRERSDALKAALVQEVFVRDTAEASSSSPATSSTSTPSSASPIATPTGPVTSTMGCTILKASGMVSTEYSTSTCNKRLPFSTPPVGSKRSHSVMDHMHTAQSSLTTSNGV